MDRNKKIFVNIAAYRDPFLTHTIQSVLENAKYPENVTIGVAWQRGEEEIDELPFDKNKVKVLKIPALHSKGACWSRNLTFQLMEDEHFFWLLDSHLMIRKNWDEILLKQYYDTNDPKALLSCAVSQWDPPHGFGHWEGNPNVRAVSRATEFLGPILLQMFETRPVSEKPELNSFLTACNLFGHSKWVYDVPYDPDLFFLGEEISLALRSFTHGYNHYATTVNMAAHKHDRHYRRVFSDDHPDVVQKLQDVSEERLIKLTTGEGDIDLGIYGNGNIRTVEQFEKYAGINFKDRTVSDRAKTGRPDTSFL